MLSSWKSNANSLIESSDKANLHPGAIEAIGVVCPFSNKFTLPVPLLVKTTDPKQVSVPTNIEIVSPEVPAQVPVSGVLIKLSPPTTSNILEKSKNTVLYSCISFPTL